jgi:hypothetical protein
LDLEMKIEKTAAALIAIALVASVARHVSAQTPYDRAQDLFEAKDVCKRHRAELVEIPHVRVVTGEVDWRNEAAILVEVDDQKNVDEVMRKVPSRIEGFPVEVDESASETQNDDSYLHGAPDSPVPPTIDKNGYYHHTWLKPSAPAAKPDAQP